VEAAVCPCWLARKEGRKEGGWGGHIRFLRVSIFKISESTFLFFDWKAEHVRRRRRR
jgi:hypothetical protein